MKEGIDILESILGEEVFHKYVHVLLTDRGAEFSAAEAMETSSDGTRRTRVFYCDPMRSGQKGTLENKHIELRLILSRLVDTFFSRISLTMQPPPKPHSTACVLPWEEGRHWQSSPPVVPVAEEVSPDKYL